MSDSARVSSIEAIRDFRTALCNFKVEAGEALTAANMTIQRMLDWLPDQLKHWRGQSRLCEEMVAKTKRDLDRKQLERMTGRIPDCTEEDKAWRRARQRLSEAEGKIEAVRRWIPQLQQAILEYEGQGRQLEAVLEHDVPRAIATLDQKATVLDSYVALESKASG